MSSQSVSCNANGFVKSGVCDIKNERSVFPSKKTDAPLTRNGFRASALNPLSQPEGSPYLLLSFFTGLVSSFVDSLSPCRLAVKVVASIPCCSTDSVKGISPAGKAAFF